MKTCTKCGEEKDLNSFSRHAGFPDDRSYWCKSCVRINNRKLYETKREELIAYSTKWCQDNRERRRLYSSAWNRNHPDTVQVGVRNRRARLANIEGKITKNEWIALKNKYNNTCLKCKRTDVKLTLDHVIPVSKGGSNTIENAQPLCLSCNSSKHDKTIDYRLEFLV